MSPSSVAFLLGAGFLPAGAAVGALSYREVRRVRRLLRSGATAQGVVTRLSATEMRSSSSEGTIPVGSYGNLVYYPVVEWVTADGRPMETTANIARPLDRTPAPGTQVCVRYDSADPSCWALESNGTGMFRGFAAIGALCAVIGAGLFVFGLALS
ncbi:DUF3592 domain-containing protein [Streptomyces smyrnaeus]|uniref:DUF3592 domain-containing protein n=1 Tax=Streptomyces smyrnaeus TaxID=1387713 RepID=A0ABS3Y0D0_9ACTN|nr:DUF3592 domain-containing protein [Streptomyces smyrnaeus]MBO8201103.1 DUF3592 domain-containing protein [Streptomyces smyrnaeus]